MAFLVENRAPGAVYNFVVWKEGTKLLYMAPAAGPDANVVETGSADALSPSGILATIGEKYPRQLVVIGECHPGRYHPRIWRREVMKKTIEPLATLPADASGHGKALAASASAAVPLLERMRALFRVVEPTPGQLLTFGHEIRHLLVLAAMEVEAAWRGVLRANGWVQPQYNTNDYVRLLDPMGLASWKVRLTRSHEDLERAPFGTWSASAPTQTLPWWEAYNATKHDSEANLSQATLGAAVGAMAALFVLLVAQFGPQAVAAHGMHDFIVVEEPAWTTGNVYVRDVAKAKEPQDQWWRPVKLFGP